jgi:hypothetical protein
MLKDVDASMVLVDRLRHEGRASGVTVRQICEAEDLFPFGVWDSVEKRLIPKVDADVDRAFVMLFLKLDDARRGRQTLKEELERLTKPAPTPDRVPGFS